MFPLNVRLRRTRRGSGFQRWSPAPRSHERSSRRLPVCPRKPLCRAEMRLAPYTIVARRVRDHIGNTKPRKVCTFHVAPFGERWRNGGSQCWRERHKIPLWISPISHNVSVASINLHAIGCVHFGSCQCSWRRWLCVCNEKLLESRLYRWSGYCADRRSSTVQTGWSGASVGPGAIRRITAL
jgi:hypothetical protein